LGDVRVTDFFCWLGIASCASHAATAAGAGAVTAVGAPEITMGEPFLYAVTWIVGVLLVEHAMLRRR
jgi:hypothetical protein